VVLELTRSRVMEERAEDVPGEEGGRVAIEGRGEAMVDIARVLLGIANVRRTVFGGKGVGKVCGSNAKACDHETTMKH